MKLIKNKDGEIPQYQLVGNIDENSDFSGLYPHLSELHIDCYEVSRINSIGVKKWIQYFAGIKSKGIKTFLYRASSAIVDQLNMIQNFDVGMNVVSVMLPYHCSQCDHSMLVAKTKAETKSTDFSKPIHCPNCNADTLKFDDEPDSYFHFWNS